MIDAEVHIGWAGDLHSLVELAQEANYGGRPAEKLDYYRHQLDLLAQMCQEQQYLAINPPPDKKLMNISQELPIDLVLR